MHIVESISNNTIHTNCSTPSASWIPPCGFRSEALSTVSMVVGWAYFLAWSVSFYPQVWENWRRKSVAGLSFDFLALNLNGWISYSIFNCVLYWDSSIQKAYLERYKPPIPVEPNDIFFGLHAFCLTVVTIGQCVYYKLLNRSSRPDEEEEELMNYKNKSHVQRFIRHIYPKKQRVSMFVIVLLILIFIASLTQLVLCIFEVEVWLDYLYYFSYVKVAMTLLKYIPQVILNWQRSSTEGWSIGNILLDTTGGILSFLQMFLDGLNNDNWRIFEGNGAKFALSIISLGFDAIFVIQHYCLYPQSHNRIKRV